MTVLSKVLRRAQAQIRHVEPVSPRAADGLVAAVYRQVEREFGMLAPPISLHSPAPALLAASWLMLRETLVVQGVVDRAAKENVARAVSARNACPYCVEVHTAVHRELGGPAEGDMPGEGEAAAEHIGVATTFEYLNRMVTVFLPPSPLPAAMPAAARRSARRMLGRVAVRVPVAPPGASLDLLPAASLPADFAWALPHSSVATAFARAAAVIDEAGRRSVPREVRDVVRQRLQRGLPQLPSRSWLAEDLDGLPSARRSVGRLALLTAASPTQVTDADVDAVRAAAGDAATVEVTAWAAFSAARAAGAAMYAAAVQGQLPA